MIPAFLDRSKIPHKPGVYIFKDTSGHILYVGKAIDLYHRVSSYFSKDPGVRSFVSKIAGVETIIVESELEALILEANLIKKNLPPFNVRLTDDKDYLYIVLTREDFPRVLTARRNNLKEFQKFWGPFPSGRTVKETLRSLRRVFPWCSLASQGVSLKVRPCFLDNGVVAKTRQRPCFYFHLGQCPGACVGLISKADYRNIIRRFSEFLDGKKEELVSELLKEMDQASGEAKFEEAGRIKKTLDGVVYLTQTNRTSLYLENPNFLQEENKIGLEQLKKDLNLKKLPERIEGYDISNISGKEATGSMVVLTNGEIDKSQYRKFKIWITGKPNDTAMMAEMIKRRLRHPEWPTPDLIIIDGGRGQARVAELEISKACDSRIFRNLKLEIPLFGLAKRLEWLYPPEGEVIKLPRRSLSLKLLQKLRDEAHRFAVAYHRKLRRKSFLKNI